MKTKEIKVRLSPNEEAQLIREERERRRILRIQQVREQQRSIAQHVREKVERRRRQELELLSEELRSQWEQQQKERVEHLQRLYQESLGLLGQSHRNAQENVREELNSSAADQKAENDSKAEERFRKALKEVNLQRLKNQENQNQSVEARRKALEVEKIRSAKMAALPPPPPPPLQEAVSKPQQVMKYDAASFAETHYHISETLVDRELLFSQPSASAEAEQETQRTSLMQRQEEQRRAEQQEKARLRGREALKREQLLQDRERLLVELPHLQQSDLLRRRQQAGAVPRQIFEPLYRRHETQAEQQRDMEIAFEDMYSGERRAKGDLLSLLVPEPLPSLSTDGFCRDLDVTQDELNSTEEEEDQAEQEWEMQTEGGGGGATTQPSEDPLQPKADEGKAAPKRGLKRLLTQIQTQRRRWSQTEAQSTDSRSGQDTSIDTGSLTTAEKLSNADVEDPEAAAAQNQELEEQRKREEALEKQRQEQMEVLQRLEQQKLRLEEKLSDAQRERETLRTSRESTDITQEDGVVNRTETTEEHRRRLMQQQQIHQRSVEVARRRLEEYKRTLQTRYNVQTVPPSAPPPAAPPSVLPPPSAVPPAALTRFAIPPSAPLPAAVQPSVLTPSALPAMVPPAAFLARPSAAVPSFAPPPPVALNSAHPSLLPSAPLPSTSVLPSTLRLPTSLPSALALRLPTSLPLSAIAPSPDRQSRPENIETGSDSKSGSKTGSDLKIGSESLAILRHKAFLKFIQDRLGVPKTDQQTNVDQSDLSTLTTASHSLSTLTTAPPSLSTFTTARPSGSTFTPSLSTFTTALPSLSTFTPSLSTFTTARLSGSTFTPSLSTLTTAPLPSLSTLTTAPLPSFSAFTTALPSGSTITPSLSTFTPSLSTFTPSLSTLTADPPLSLSAFTTASLPSLSTLNTALPGSISSTSRISRPTVQFASSTAPDLVGSTMAGPSPVVTMATHPGPAISTGSWSGHGQTVPDSSVSVPIRPGRGSFVSIEETPSHVFPSDVLPDPVVSIATDHVPPRLPPPDSRWVEVGREKMDRLGEDGRENLESSDDQEMTSQPQQEVQVQTLDQGKPQEQARSNLLQTLLNALGRLTLRDAQPEASGSRSSSSSPSSSGSSGVSTPKPPVSRSRLGFLGGNLHQLSVIEEVNTPGSASLLTGDDTATAEEFQVYKGSSSSLSSLSDLALFLDSPQSLLHEFSGSSTGSSSKYSSGSDGRARPSLSSTISSGSYVTTDPELLSQPDGRPAPLQSPVPTVQQVQEDPESRSPQFAPVETADTLPTEEPSVLDEEDSFRPLVGVSDQSTYPGGEETLNPRPEETLHPGLEQTLGSEDVTLGLVPLMGHPSAHSSLIG